MGHKWSKIIKCTEVRRTWQDKCIHHRRKLQKVGHQTWASMSTTNVIYTSYQNNINRDSNDVIELAPPPPPPPSSWAPPQCHAPLSPPSQPPPPLGSSPGQSDTPKGRQWWIHLGRYFQITNITTCYVTACEQNLGQFNYFCDKAIHYRCSIHHVLVFCVYTVHYMSKLHVKLFVASTKNTGS